MKVAISLGGSIFSKEEGIDTKYLKKFSQAILPLSNDHRIYIVTGGGRAARRFIKAGRQFCSDEYFLDLLGIRATRLNAMIVSASLGQRVFDCVPEKVEEADLERVEKIFVMGGTVPGHTTDAVTAMLAAHTGADLFINATNVDGVYEMDPRANPEAKLYENLTAKQLQTIVKTIDYKAGKSTVIDPKAAKIIAEKKIPTIILDGRQVRNIIDAINGKRIGTLIKD